MRISELPDELLLGIVNLVDDKKSLCALAQVSRQFQGLSEPLIYSNFLIRHRQACNDIKQAIETSPRKATYIKVLDLRLEYSHATDFGRNIITSVLSQCTKLEELTVESPFCNYMRWPEDDDCGWGDIESYLPTSVMEAMNNASAKGLTKLVLHLESPQNRYWDPNDGREYDGREFHDVSWSEVMALPTLRELTISCASIHDAVHIGTPRSSLLKEMTLIECNISVTGLSNILSAPMALETLYLGENIFHGNSGTSIPLPLGEGLYHYNEVFAQYPDEFISALEQQSHSLRKFDYITLQCGLAKSASRSFKDFAQLRDVTLSVDTQDRGNTRSLQRALVSQDSPPRLASLRIDISAKELFGELEILHNKVESSERKPTPEDVSSQMASLVSTILFPLFSREALQNLQELHLILSDSYRVPRHVPGVLRQEWTKLMMAHWRNYDVKFFQYVRMRNSAYPPILFGEEPYAPRDVLVYSSESGFLESSVISH